LGEATARRFFAAAYFPAVHSVQPPTAASTALAKPAGHSSHEVPADAAPKEPAGQTAHAWDPLASLK
jgi:hypothetical protein